MFFVCLADLPKHNPDFALIKKFRSLTDVSHRPKRYRKMKSQKSGKNFRAWLERRMDKRSTEGVPGEWRQQGFSGQAPCRTSIGAAYRGGVPILALAHYGRMVTSRAKHIVRRSHTSNMKFLQQGTFLGIKQI
jgi:hypothetical protein